MSVYCGFVDVSHHTRAARGGPLDWSAIAADGLSTVMMARATYGDPQGFAPQTFYFGEFMTGAKAAGYTCRGGYHNLIRGDAASIARQVDWLRRELDRYGAESAMADVERYDELVANDLWPRFDDVLRFHDRWYTKDERVMAWYIPRWDWDGHLGRPDLRGLHGPLIGSAYEDNAALAWRQLYEHEASGGVRAFDPYGGRTPEIGQIGSNCVVHGSGPRTDVNIYRGPVDDLVALLTGGNMATAQEIAAAVLGAQYKDYVDPDGDGVRTPITVIDALLKTRADSYAARLEVAAVHGELAGLKTLVTQLVADDQVGLLSDAQLADLKAAVELAARGPVDELLARLAQAAHAEASTLDAAPVAPPAG